MVGALLIGLKIFAEKIGKEKQLENGEHNDQFNDNNFPQGLAHRHAAEAVEVKMDDSCEREIFHHGGRLVTFHEKTGLSAPGQISPERSRIPSCLQTINQE